MPLVSSSIANLVNGVSQQPYTLRLASQAEVQENGLSTVSQGLKKRPPTRHVKKILNSPVGSAFIHTINRDTSEQYEVVITNGDLKVFDINGVQKTVLFPDGIGYLSASDPKTQFRAVTVADYTFILNKSVIAQASSTLGATRPYEALVNVRTGLYSKTYAIIINGSTVASFSTPDGTVAAHALQISTDYIAQQLAAAFPVSGITATVYGSVIHLSHATTNFTVAATDGYNNAAMLAIKGQLQRFSDLPANAGADGFTVEIVGDQSSAFDNYWVKFDKSSSAGVWKECAKPGISVGLNATTMPFALVRESSGDFTFKKLTWTSRTVGDETSAPHPSFVGRKLSALFFWRNRLGLLADESFVLSEAGEFFNFYRTTVTTLVDSDPIDVSVSHTKVSNLIDAVPFAKQLVLFSAQTQFVVESGDLLTAKTISVKPTTEFESDTGVSPVGVNRTLYFAVPKGDHTGLREYYVEDDTGENNAVDVTSHVPEYVPTGVFKIAAGLNEDVLCMLTSEEPNAIYVYKFYWDNRQKLQSSWSKWLFPETDTVLNADFIQSVLVLLINRSDGVYLEALEVAISEDLGNEPYRVHLDRKRTISKTALTYSAPYTIIDPSALIWNPTDGDYVAVVATGQPKKAGILADVVWSGGQAKILGNFTNNDLVVGRKYTFRYRFSTLVPKIRSGQSEKADTLARLQVRNMQVQYSDTGYFQAKVTPYGRPTYTYTFTGKVLGVPSATIGEVGLETGSFRFPVMTQNIHATVELVSDSPLPCSFLSADWEGFYAKRSQGI